MFETDADRRLRFVSAAWERATAIPTERLIGQPASALILPEDRGILEAQFDAVAQTGLEQTAATVRIAGPAPERLYRLRAGPARATDAVSGGVVGLLADVTDHERREAALRHSERLASLGTLLATAAHELNNPLAAISGFSQLLLGSPHPDETREALGMIHHEATRAARTVRDLLGFSRARQMEQRVPVDINSVVAQLVATRRYALETRGIACEMDLGPSLPPVTGERSQLEQLILALVINAEQVLERLADAAPGRAVTQPLRLAIRTWFSDGRVHLAVMDSGPGIPPDDLPSIWDPFWTTKPEGEGTGLGLAIAHGIVESHGGTIDVTSSDGAGTMFVVSLPACDDALPGDGSGTGASSRPLDVLVVGRARSLTFLQRYLASRGHAILTASTPARALRVARQVPLDVVICSVGRNEGAVAGLVRALRSLGDQAPGRIVLALQQRLSDADRGPLGATGAAMVLTPPYEIEAIRRAVEG